MIVRSSFLPVMLLSCGCGTGLVVEEIPRRSETLQQPDGIVVNQRRVYKTNVKAHGDLAMKKSIHVKAAESRLVGVDHETVLVVNMERQLFASGTLSVNLDEAQRIKKVGLTSATGAPAAVTTVDRAVTTTKTVHDITKD